MHCFIAYIWLYLHDLTLEIASRIQNYSNETHLAWNNNPPSYRGHVVTRASSSTMDEFTKTPRCWSRLGVRGVLCRLIHYGWRSSSENNSPTRLRADSFPFDTTRLYMRSLTLQLESNCLKRVLYRVRIDFIAFSHVKWMGLRRLHESLAHQHANICIDTYDIRRPLLPIKTPSAPTTRYRNFDKVETK